MNIKHRMFWLATLSSTLILAHARADIQVDAPPKTPPPTAQPAVTNAAAAVQDAIAPVATPGTQRTGVVTGNHVNVRGQATTRSEVVARLNKGDQVRVIKEVIPKKPRAGEPAKWYQIQLPEGTFVWVHSMYVDTSSLTVTATELNLRSGPGENYSVLGRINKGASVKVLATKGDWLKIEPPATAGAYVAASLLRVAPVAAPPPMVVAVPEPDTNAVPAEVVETTPPVEPVPVTPVPEPIPTPPGETIPAPPVEPISPPAVAEPTPEETVPVPPVEEPPPKRTVMREGIVKRSVSIQAPTEFVLESLDTKRTINYLYSPSTNIVLLDFKGQRILVTGEEGLDDRWPRTPVLTIETLKSMP